MHCSRSRPPFCQHLLKVGLRHYLDTHATISRLIPKVTDGPSILLSRVTPVDFSKTQVLFEEHATELHNQINLGFMDSDARSHEYVLNTLPLHHNDMRTNKQMFICLYLNLSYMKRSVTRFYRFWFSDSHQPVTTSFQATSPCSVVTDFPTVSTLE